MNASCTNCGTNLDPSSSFCRHCGLAVSHETHSEAAQVHHRRTSMPGTLGGLLFGLLFTPVLIIAGALLCLTGLGAILGIPVLIMAAIAPLAGSLMGMSEHGGKCPSCGRLVLTVEDGKFHPCPACNRDFALDDNGFVKAA